MRSIESVELKYPLECKLEFLRCQISSRMKVMVRETIRWSDAWLGGKGGLRIRLVMSYEDVAAKSSDLNPQTAVNHKALAIWHLRNKWIKSSGNSEHRRQESSFKLILILIFSLVGSTLTHILQRNILVFSGAFMFQSFFQLEVGAEGATGRWHVAW